MRLGCRRNLLWCAQTCCVCIWQHAGESCWGGGRGRDQGDLFAVQVFTQCIAALIDNQPDLQFSVAVGLCAHAYDAAKPTACGALLRAAAQSGPLRGLRGGAAQQGASFPGGLPKQQRSRGSIGVLLIAWRTARASRAAEL